MPASQLVSAQYGIIASSKNADGDIAELVVQTAILVRRSMEPTAVGRPAILGSLFLHLESRLLLHKVRVVAPARARVAVRDCGADRPKRPLAFYL